MARIIRHHFFGEQLGPDIRPAMIPKPAPRQARFVVFPFLIKQAGGGKMEQLDPELLANLGDPQRKQEVAAPCSARCSSQSDTEGLVIKAAQLMTASQGGRRWGDRWYSNSWGVASLWLKARQAIFRASICRANSLPT